MELYKAITDITTRFGTVSIATRQFVNLLDDVGAFRNEPAATKKIMKDLLASGLGELLYQLSENKTQNWQNSVRKCVGDYIVKSGYQDTIVNNISTQLLYGLGLIDELPKAEETKPLEAKPQIRIKDPKELMYALKQEYITALSELLTITTDEFGHKYGYYTTEANTKLYVLDGKIRLLARELGIDDIGTWLSEERQKIESQNRPTNEQIQQAINDQLGALEREFEALMEQGYEVIDDEFGLHSASFRHNVISDFHAIEEKIIKLGKRKNENKSVWIDQAKEDFLISKSSPLSARTAVLDQLKNDYLARLNELDKATKVNEINFSDTELREIRRKLVILGSLLNINMEAWCDSENVKLTNQRNARAAKRKKRNILIGAVASVALAFGGWEGGTYATSADDRAKFEQTMASANSEYSQGNLIQALSLYQKAENEYTAFYSSSSYKSKAHAKAKEVSDQLISDWASKIQSLLADDHPADAKLLTLSLPENLVKEGESGKIYSSLTEKINKTLELTSTQIINKLLTDVYANHGKLSKEGQHELEAMLKIMPDNYWLNFIMNKVR